jgi:hypothetical protein
MDSSKRVASLHLAKMQKRAGVVDNLKEKVTKAVVVNEAMKIRSGISGTALKNIQELFSSHKMSLSQMTKAKVDRDDPIQKMLSDRLSNAKTPQEASNIVGEFQAAFKKKNIKEMAKIVDVAPETMTVVLLWYVRDDKSLWVNKTGEKPEFMKTGSMEKTSNILWTYMVSALGWTGWIATQIIYYIGVGAGWLFNFILPTSISGNVVYIGLAKAVGTAWSGLFVAINAIGSAITALLTWIGGHISFFTTLKFLGVAVVIYYIVMLVSWGVFKTQRLPGKLFVETPLKMILKFLNMVGKGLYKMLSGPQMLVDGAVVQAEAQLGTKDPVVKAIPKELKKPSTKKKR